MYTNNKVDKFVKKRRKSLDFFKVKILRKLSENVKKCFENIQTNFVFGQARLKSDLDFVILMYIILKNKK